MDFKKWIKIFSLGSFTIIIILSAITIFIDPFFHFHKPISKLYYPLLGGYERYINNGIIKNFEYNAIVTGTSMTENFKASEVENLFGGKVIKIPFAGASFYEINQNIENAYKYRKIDYVIRGLDMRRFNDSPTLMRNDLGNYPIYLLNDDVFDDFSYFINKDSFVLCLKILNETIKRGGGGMTSFDEYANWNDRYLFSKNEVLKDKDIFKFFSQGDNLSLKDRKNIEDNIERNVVELAKKHPETTFYYFFTPYSIIYWNDLYKQGDILKSIEAERMVIEKVLECSNIKLYTFNLQTDVITDLNNYKDKTHYGEWINSKILLWIKNDIGLLTKDNYKEYLQKEYEFYSNFNYNSIF